MPSTPSDYMTTAQQERLIDLHERYGVPYDPRNFVPAFDLPAGWVIGWIGGAAQKLYVGVSPEGEVHS